MFMNLHNHDYQALLFETGQHKQKDWQSAGGHAPLFKIEIKPRKDR